MPVLNFKRHFVVCYMRTIVTMIIGGLVIVHSLQAQAINLNKKKSHQTLLAFANEQNEAGWDLPLQVLGVSVNYTDLIIQNIETSRWVNPLFRAEEAYTLSDILSRKQGAYPVIVGESGVGKSSVVRLFTHDLLVDELPDGIQRESLSNAIVLQVSLRLLSLSTGGMDFNAYLSAVDAMRRHTKRKIIVYLTETQYFDKYHATVLHERLRNEPNDLHNNGHVPVILEANNKAMSTNLTELADLNGVLAPIRISQIKPEQLVEVLQTHLLPALEAKTNVSVSEEVLRAAIDIAPDYRIDLGEPTRTQQLIEDFVIYYGRSRTDRNADPSKIDLYKFVAKQTGLPVVPQNEGEFAQFIENLRAKLKKIVINQDHIVDGLLDQFRTALSSRTRKHSVAMVMGTTGVGKSYVAELIGSEFYDGNKERTLKLDMTQFMDKEALNVLFGAANGYVSAAENKGTICEFLDGAGRGGGIIILNEIEKAHSDVITRLMELFDNGEIRCGDGRVRYLGHSLVVMTSNKNTDHILSYESIKDMSAEELDRRIAQITEKMMQDAFTTKASYTEDASKVVGKPVVQRVDKWYFAKPLLSAAAVNIAILEIEKYKRQFEMQGDRTLTVDESFAQILANSFYSAENGARQIRSAVAQQLTNVIEEFKSKHGYNFKHLNVSARLHPVRKTESYLTAIDPDSELQVVVFGPHIPVTNKLYDADFRQKLQSLEADLKSEIFGQNFMIETIDAVIKARYLVADTNRPASVFVGGPTGTGKTQVAKLIAKYLYGRSTAYGSFHMGEINNELDLGNIFSPAKGVIGSDEPGELEQFLINNPEGGVLNFSEISNAGGGNMAIKTMVYKNLYRMIDEGYYTNPSGKRYALANYYIQFDGNDGEEIYRGAGSESSINEIYNEMVKKPHRIRQILREHGAPDAFLGRIGGYAITRPAAGDNKFEIAKKMLSEWEKQVERSQPIDIEYSEYFISEIAELMYSPTYGARSINQYITNTLGKIVSNDLLGLDWDHLIETGQRVKVNLTLDVTKPSEPFYSSQRPDKKQAIVYAEFTLEGKVVSVSNAEFTNDASFLPQVHTNKATATAIHEMGHALNDHTEWTGLRVTGISIVPQEFNGGMALGVTRYDDEIPSIYESNWDVLVRRLAGVLAGSEAEMLDGADSRNTGRSNDVMKAGQYARRFILESHLLPELDGAHAYVDSKGEYINLASMPANLRKAFDKYVNKAIEEGRVLARKHMKQNWHVMKAGQELLMKHHEITGEEYYELVRRGEEAKQKAGWLKRKLVENGAISAVTAYPLDLTGIIQPKTKLKTHKADELPKNNILGAVRSSSGDCARVIQEM